MSTPKLNTRRRSLAMDRTGQWVFSQDIPTDIIIQIGESIFPLHKFMLVAKSNYIRQLVLDSADTDLTRIDLSYLPGGPETFEKVVKFCYSVNFEITVQNVAALRCAAEYLEMTDECCPGNLANRTEDFINQAALTTLSGAIVVLKSCEDDLLLPVAQTLRLVQRCADVISSKACSEATFPSRKPLNWWTEDLSILNLTSFQNVIASMKSRPTKTIIIASAIVTYAERSLRDLVRDHSGNGVATSYSIDSDIRVQQKEHLEAIVALFPQDQSAFPIGFLCSLLRCAIFLKASDLCKKGLEKRVSALLEHATVDDLLVLSYTYDGESLFDLESVRRIVSGFVTREISMVDDVFSGGGGSFRGGAETKNTICSAAIQRVAKTIDAYLGEIATHADLSISKFNGIANLVPKGSRRVEDDLYRAIDIYLKAHPSLDEIEREKVCSSMDPLKLSYEARVHASQNKRLPVQIVLHALYYDQLKIRSGANEVAAAGGGDQSSYLDSAAAMRGRVTVDSSLVRENEVLKSELMKMKMYISDHLERNPGGSSTSYSKNSSGGGPGGGGVSTSQKKGTFFTTMSKKLGKLNPFRHGSKDTTNIDDGGVDITKPRRRRFSIS